jgi:thiol-disulfide isomerase/thioredoxin
MKILRQLLFIVLFPASLAAQPWYIQLAIDGMDNQKIVLNRFEKTAFVPVDSTVTISGQAYFVLDEFDPAGTYSITYPGSMEGAQQREGYIEFVWNAENLTISASLDDIPGSVSFGNSMENEVLGRFRVAENAYEQKLALIFPVIDRYPEEDAFYRSALRQLIQLQRRRDSLIGTISEQFPSLYATRIVSAYRSVIIDSAPRGADRVAFLKIHFFDRSPIDDPDLMYSPIYTRKIIEYLSLYRNPSYTFREQEEAFIEAVDMIMANVSGDVELRTFVIEYLLDGFNSFQMERVQTHITENYIDETCTTDKLELARQRAEGFKKMAVGQPAADIVIRDARNRTIKLSEVKSDYTLVIFWATYCSHCTKMLPELKEWYLEDAPDNLEIFAISIDTIRQHWTGYLEAMDMPWINAHEPLGWEGRSAEDYNVYATPTMFLLDRKRIILAKPLTLRELRKDLRSLE